MLKELMLELKNKREALETKTDMTDVEVKAVKDSISELEVKISAFIENEMKRADEMEKKLNSPEYAAREKGVGAEDAEIKAYKDYLLTGEIDTKSINSLNGAVLIPHKLVVDMDSAIADEVFIEKHATVITGVAGTLDVSSIETDDDAEFFGDDTAIDGDIVGDLFTKKTYTPAEVSRMIKIADSLVTNSGGNVEKLVQARYIENVAEVKEKHYIAGTGVGQPLGILNTVGMTTLYTGGTTIALGIEDDILDLIGTLKARFRKDGALVMSRSTKTALGKLRHDVSGEYLFPEIRKADPTLEGYVVFESEHCPDNKILFYSKKRYRIVKGKGLEVKIFDQTYAAKNQIGYRFKEFVDGGMSRKDAAAVLVIGVEPVVPD